MSSSSSSSVSSKAVKAPIPNPFPKSHLDKCPCLQVALPQIPKEVIGIIGSFANEILGGLYGEDAWKKWKGVEILDTIPRAPLEPIGNRILLYMPSMVRIRGQNKILTVDVLTTISGVGIRYIEPEITQPSKYEYITGWVFLDKDVIPESRGKGFIDQAWIADGRDCQLMHPLEALTLPQMVFAFTGVQLFRDTYTTCHTRRGEDPTMVVGYNSKAGGLWLTSFSMDHYKTKNGIAGARRAPL